MPNPYHQILSKPGALGFSSAGLIARLPMSMVGIGIVLLISDLYSSYALAGQVSAVYIAAQATCAPQLAKLVDRHGQARVMRPALAISMTGLALLIWLATAHSPAWMLMATAVITGATIGSLGALVRTRWTAVVSSPGELHVAYSLESALDELVFIVGPVLATMLAVSVSPQAGLIVAIVAGLAGGFWFLGQRASEPTPNASRGAGRPSLLRSPEIVAICLVFVCVGAIFGATDVSVVAFAEEQGRKGAAGIVLAIFAGGSLVSGLLYGSRTWRSSMWRRFAVGIALLAVGVTLFFFVDSLTVLAMVMFVTGFAISPTIINGNGLVQEIVAQERLTEGLTWIGTAIGVGVAAGAAVAGAVIDEVDAHAGFLVVMGSAALSVVLTIGMMLVRRRELAQAAAAAASTGTTQTADSAQTAGTAREDEVAPAR